MRKTASQQWRRPLHGARLGTRARGAAGLHAGAPAPHPGRAGRVGRRHPLGGVSHRLHADPARLPGARSAKPHLCARAGGAAPRVRLPGLTRAGGGGAAASGGAARHDRLVGASRHAGGRPRCSICCACRRGAALPASCMSAAGCPRTRPRWAACCSRSSMPLRSPISTATRGSLASARARRQPLRRCSPRRARRAARLCHADGRVRAGRGERRRGSARLERPDGCRDQRRGCRRPRIGYRGGRSDRAPCAGCRRRDLARARFR